MPPKAGLELNCKNCLLDNWLSLKNIDDNWICEYCGSQNLTSIELSNRGDWKFRKSGLLGKDNNQEGAIPVILTLLLFNNCIGDMRLQNMIYSTSLNLNLCIINTHPIHGSGFEIAIGECKDSGDEIDENDIKNLKAIRQNFIDKGIDNQYFLLRINQFCIDERISIDDLHNVHT